MNTRLPDKISQVQPAHLRRLVVLGLAFAMAFTALGARLVQLQLYPRLETLRDADQRTHQTTIIEPPRGEIRDCQGRPLAISRPMKRVLANPYYIGPYAHWVAEKIAPLLDYEPQVLAALLQPSWRTNDLGQVRPVQYVNLRREMDPQAWFEVEKLMHNLSFPVHIKDLPKKQRDAYQNLRQRSIYAEDFQDRIYPNGPLAAHVLGFTKLAPRTFNGRPIELPDGVTGVERQLQTYLEGQPGWRTSGLDNRRREIVSLREEDVAPKPGLNVELTLDLVVQSILERELAAAMLEFRPLAASALITRPRTGEIIALASLPNYDPNDPGSVPVAHWRNRVIADQMEPGSTFKIVTIAAALNEKVVQLETPIDCENGYWIYGGRSLRDAAGHGHDVLSVENVLVKSSNIGTAKVALMLGDQRFYEYVRSFGFGSRCAIPLDGEIPGLVHPVKSWDRLTITRMPMGHAVAVTHLQLAMAISALANHGLLMRPMLIKRLYDSAGRNFAVYAPQSVRQIIEPETAALVTKALINVVNGEGTGRHARLKHYTVAGKTGTAVIPNPPHGYLDEDIHSFMGFLPADNPEISVTVVLERPRKGRFASTTAVPTFRLIAEQTARHLGIRPDRPSDQVAAITSPAQSP